MSYNRKVKHIESIYVIDVPDNFRDLFKDKYSNPRSSNPRENQSRPRKKIIFNLQQYYYEREVKINNDKNINTFPTMCKSRLAIIKTKALNIYKSEK